MRSILRVTFFAIWAHLGAAMLAQAQTDPTELAATACKTGDDRLITAILGRLEYAREIVLKSETIEKKMRDAVKSGKIPKKKGPELLEESRAKGIITSEEHALMKEVASVRWDAIQVDDFSEEVFVGNKA